MLRLRKKRYAVGYYRLFLLGIVLSVALFGYRVQTGSVITPLRDGEVMNTADQYQFGRAYDRTYQLLVSGDGNEVVWKNSTVERLFDELISPDIEKTVNSRFTVAGNCSWLFGTEDQRFTKQDFLDPDSERSGGAVKLTLDLELQTYIDQVMKEHGYEEAYVVVSNYRTGELLAMYGDVLRETLHPGSTLKPILAAAVLSIDPEMESYVYHCTPANHIFDIEGGVVQIDCAGGSYHGEMSLAEALKYSCNGYFISLIQQVDREKLLEVLKTWGFDSTISYPQFMYWDHAFVKGSGKEIDYLLAAIGQSNAYITPAGLNFCTNALLNHGTIVEPIWFSAKQSTPESNWERIERAGSTEICEPAIADRVTEMLLDAVESGTGKSFWMEDFAAKTGTAQKSDQYGNITGLNTIWTTGGLTNEDTPYSITVCLDNVTDGSAAAGRLARTILQHMIGEEGAE